MSKVETLVWLLMLSVSSLGWAEASTKEYTQAPICSDKMTDAQCQQVINAYVKSTAGSSCDTASKDYNSALKDFGKACGKVNITKGQCESELAKCQKTEDDPDDKSSSRSSDGAATYDVNGVKKQCPSMAAADIDKYEKEWKDQKDKVDKLKKELPDLQDKSDKIVTETNDKLNEMTQQAAKDQSAHAKELADISKGREAAEKAIQDQVTGIQTQISQAKDALSQSQLARVKANLDMNNQKTQVDINCYDQAAAQVAKMQGDVLAANAAGAYNRGGFSHLLNSVGVSDRAQWQRISQKYYNYCKQDKKTMESKNAASAAYALAMQQQDVVDNSIKDKVNQLQAQQLTLVNGSQVCGTPVMQGNGSTGGETALCQAARQASQAAAQSEQDYRSGVQANAQKYQSIATQAQKQHDAAEKEIADKKREIADENNRLDNLQQFLQAKRAKAGNSGTDSKTSDVNDAMGQLAIVQDDAKMVISCQKTDALSKGVVGDFCKDDGSCNSALGFLQRSEPNPDDDKTLDTNLEQSQIDSFNLKQKPAAAQPAATTPGTGTGK